jgi:Tfp pilus assembly protein PilV
MHRRSSGEGLLETMATLVLIAVSVLALIRFQNYLAYTGSTTRQQSDATILAINQIEKLRDFQVINNTSGYTSYQSIASGTSTSSTATTTYTTTWTVTPFTNPNYKTIDVTVSWTDRYNTAQSIRLTSMVASLDPAFSASIM